MLGILDLSGTDVLGQIILCWWGRGEGLPIVVTAAVSVGSVHKMPVLIPLNPSCGDYIVSGNCQMPPGARLSPC